MSSVIYETDRQAMGSGNAGPLSGTPKRAALVAIETPNGDSAMDDTNDAVRVNVVAGSGPGGGGTSMVDDAAFTAGTTEITPAGGFYSVARDTVNDGDGGALAMTSVRGLLASIETPTGDTAMDDVNDALRVNIVAGAGSGGTAMTDESAFTSGTTTFTPIGGVFEEAITTPADGEGATVRITENRAIHTNLRNYAGAETGVLAVPLRVDPTGTTSQPVLGTKSSDAGAPGATNLGTLPAVATTSAPSYTDTRQVALSVDLSGSLRTTGYAVIYGTDSGTPTIVAVDSSGDVKVVGAAAHDAAVAGNPVLAGAEARTTIGTAVAAGDAVRVTADRYGRLYHTAPQFSQASSNATAITTATDTTAISAPAASSHLKIWRLHAVNSSATATWVYWRSTTTGTRRYPMYLAQNAIASIPLDGGWHLGSAEALVITTTGAGNVEWHVDYETVAD